jgi:hypothetical protein
MRLAAVVRIAGRTSISSVISSIDIADGTAE